MSSITFIDSMKAWENAMHNRDSSELEKILSDDFVWENIAMDGTSSKAETIQFATGIKKEVPSFQIGNYKSLHEGDGLLVGTHSVHQDGRDETIVLCLANKSEDGMKITKWRHLRAELSK
tara:strand:- start:11 stop:370 length:360 start_codon:yes stop_codon:yes gene_type:complete